LSSTSGLKSGSLLNELARQKRLRHRMERRARYQQQRAAMWKERALAAEWGLKQRRAA
jgi:hypothetical protein